MKISLHLIVSGRVQGVCFRHYCREQASLIGVAGWVRNLDDGRVEIAAEGEEESVRRFAAWCRRGPRHAMVTDVAESFGPATGGFTDFDIRF